MNQPKEIKVFHPDIESDHNDYDSKWFDALYQLEEKHFWFIARNEFLYRQLTQHVPKNAKIIEIGAGTGNVTRYLLKNGYSDISVGDMHLKGLEYAQNYGIKNCYQFDLLRMPFENEFDGVLLFDVLEHIENDDFAIQNIYKVLKINGYFALTVPAHGFLWNYNDIIAGHKRRYNKKELVNLLQRSGFDVFSCRYFFMSIVPLLFLRKLLNPAKSEDVNDKKTEENSETISINPLINKLLLFISRLENKINKFLPNLFGGSLFLIARKKS